MKVVSRFAAIFFVLTCAWLALTGWFSAKREAQRAEQRIGADVVALLSLIHISEPTRPY